jgi:hypothetical protein
LWIGRMHRKLAPCIQVATLNPGPFCTGFNETSRTLVMLAA